MNIIPAWSYSRLKDGEKCMFMLYLKAKEKRSQAHMDRTAADRGTMMHAAAENFVNGTGEFISELKHFRDYFADLKIKYESGDVVLEEDWGFDNNWIPTGWFDKNVWCRMKLDNFITHEEEYGTATDYKSGKRYGNEVSHNQQGQLYAIGSFMRKPALQVCDVELVYLDQSQVVKKTYTRKQAMLFLPHWNKRALRITEATDFPPRANKMTCMWCPYGPQNGDSSCEWGI